MGIDEDQFGWVGSDLGGAAVTGVAARGGFGIVYRAKHKLFGADVAIKCLDLRPTLTEKERSRFLQLFLREARALYQLTRITPQIVQPLNVGADRSPSGAWTPWLMMEWLEGQTLRAELDSMRPGGMVPAKALRLLGPIAEALSVAHEEGIAHRDVNPANIFVCTRGTRTVTKLLDFGLAKFMRSAGAAYSLPTTTGTPLDRTLRYAAPEQHSRSYGSPGICSDVFALALVFVECVAGRCPLEGDALAVVRQAVDPVGRPTLRRLGVACDDAVDDCLETALAVDARARFANVGEFWSELRTALTPSRRARA